MSSEERKGSKGNLKLENKVAIVTGAASGIGRAIAIRFGQEGAKVVIFDINEKGARKVAREIGRQALATKVDVRVPRQVASAVKKVIKKFGQIDILVNNAGITLPLANGILNEKAQEAWKEVISTNLHGPFLMTERVAKAMVENGWQGKVINITSVHSQIPAINQAQYAAAKAGLLAATQNWALELGKKGIRVNALAPGAIGQTGMNRGEEPPKAEKASLPLSRWGKPEEIASAAVFLASDEASYITGHELVVDGGFSLTH